MEDKSIRCIDLGSGQYIEVPRKSFIFRPAVFGVIIKEESILLVLTRHGYSLPGGKIEPNETPEEALVREIYEETGLTAGAIKPLSNGEDFYVSAYDRKAYHSVFTIYSCDEVFGEVSTDQFNDYEAKYYRKAEWVLLTNKEITANVYPNGFQGLLRKQISQNYL